MLAGSGSTWFVEGSFGGDRRGCFRQYSALALTPRFACFGGGEAQSAVPPVFWAERPSSDIDADNGLSTVLWALGRSGAVYFFGAP